MAFDSIQIRFKNIKEWQSSLTNTRVVPFVESYFSVIKSCIEDIRTEYFWVFASFLKLDKFDFDYIPEQFEKDQMHVWYTTHPLGGLNQEGNILLIPTKQFKEQLKNLKFLRDYKDINYHAELDLWQPPCPRVYFKLKSPVDDYNKSDPMFYKWMINNDLQGVYKPNFYPSFWEDVKLYSWGKTKDIMLVPYKENIKQFYDFDRTMHFDFEYDVKPMDIIFISYDEPSAETSYNKLKEKYPRAKWSKGVQGRTLAYQAAAMMSETEYFFAVWPKLEIVDTFDFSFQPDRMKHSCHYIFNAKNPINGLEYGHGAVLLYHKWLTINNTNPGIDFTLSQPHETVPILSAINHFNETSLMAWRTTFREVVKLNMLKPTVESRYRLKKWCELGTGKNAEWVYKGAQDATEFFNKNSNNSVELHKSYELDWLKEKFKTIS